MCLYDMIIRGQIGFEILMRRLRPQLAQVDFVNKLAGSLRRRDFSILNHVYADVFVRIRSL